MNVGIIGLGYVGTALKEGFKHAHHIETYDLRKDLSTCQSIDDLLKKTDFVFICVPTPMNEDGSSNLNIVHKVLKKFHFQKYLKKQILLLNQLFPLEHRKFK